MTLGMFWSKCTNPVAEGKCFQNELVMDLLVAREKRAMPYALPEVLRRNNQSQNGTVTPVQSLGTHSRVSRKWHAVDVVIVRMDVSATRR